MMKKTKIIIGVLAMVAVVLVVAGLDYANKMAQEQNKQKQAAAAKAALDSKLTAFMSSYDTTTAKVTRLSELPPSKQAPFIAGAAQYYGVEPAGGHPATDIQVVSACMTERNSDLARTIAGEDSGAISAGEQQLAHLRTMIAEDCYGRYSMDGKVPASFSRDVHNH